MPRIKRESYSDVPVLKADEATRHMLRRAFPEATDGEIEQGFQALAVTTLAEVATGESLTMDVAYEAAKKLESIFPMTASESSAKA